MLVVIIIIIYVKYNFEPFRASGDWPPPNLNRQQLWDLMVWHEATYRLGNEDWPEQSTIADSESARSPIEATNSEKGSNQEEATNRGSSVSNSEENVLPKNDTVDSEPRDTTEKSESKDNQSDIQGNTEKAESNDNDQSLDVQSDEESKKELKEESKSEITSNDKKREYVEDSQSEEDIESKRRKF